MAHVELRKEARITWPRTHRRGARTSSPLCDTRTRPPLSSGSAGPSASRSRWWCRGSRARTTAPAGTPSGTSRGTSGASARTARGHEARRTTAPVRIARTHRWDLSVEAALRLQRRLAAAVDTGARLARVRLVAGADAAYHQDGERLVAAVVVIALPGLEVVEQASAEGRVTFPYVPGLFGFREAPIVLRACRRLRARPDVRGCG